MVIIGAKRDREEPSERVLASVPSPLLFNGVKLSLISTWASLRKSIKYPEPQRTAPGWHRKPLLLLAKRVILRTSLSSWAGMVEKKELTTM